MGLRFLKRPAVLAAPALSALLLGGLARPANAQLQGPSFSSTGGEVSFRMGILAQAQAEALDTADAQHSSNNLFFRRLRAGGLFKVGDKLSVFFETDSPNLGKGNADGSKNQPDLFIQHFQITYALAHELMLEGGMLLTPNSYNHSQSAATLLGIDTGAYTFIESAPITGRNGRDYGAQLRGYLGDDHVEYRVGLYQGLRGKNNTNAFRSVGRLAVYLWGAQTGIFYRGTSLGKLATLAFGGSYDVQKTYHSYTGDVFWEQPVTGGDGITIQGDYTRLDGKDFITALPKQTDTFVEAGYYLHAITFQPFFQYARQSFAVAKANDEHRTGFGGAYYFLGHNSNLKFAWTQIDHRNAKKRNDLVLQYQVWVF